MGKNMDVTDILVSELAEAFIWYVENASVDTLKNTYINDVMDDEENENSIGKFRLIHTYTNKDEYITFIARFNKVDDVEELSVYCVEKNEIVMECTRKPENGAWSPNIEQKNILLSEVTRAASKLRDILIK